jgi:Mce-associated membrane protein
LAAGGIGAGGYFALRSHHESQVIDRNNAAALDAAKACIAATQAPDTNTISQSEQKIIDCGTDEYRSQAMLYTSMLVQAYQAANIHVQVTDERAAIERNNNDGSVDILVALRVRVTNSAAQNQETGYRLRVRMTPVEGQYKISKLDQVTK